MTILESLFLIDTATVSLGNRGRAPFQADGHSCCRYPCGVNRLGMSCYNQTTFCLATMADSQIDFGFSPGSRHHVVHCGRGATRK